MKTKKYQKGFAALILVVLVASFLLATVLESTTAIALVFDEARQKQHRFMAAQAGLACLDQAILELTHDYFFEIDAFSGVSYQALHCSIVSVGETSGYAEGDGYVTIVVVGNSDNVTDTIVVQVLLSDQKISLLSEKSFF